LNVSQNRREPRVALRIWEELMRVARRGARVDWLRLERFIVAERGDRLLQHAAFVVAALVIGKRVWIWEATATKKTHIALKVDLKAAMANAGRPAAVAPGAASPAGAAPGAAPQAPKPALKIKLGGTKLKLKLGGQSGSTALAADTTATAPAPKTDEHVKEEEQ